LSSDYANEGLLWLRPIGAGQQQLPGRNAETAMRQLFRNRPRSLRTGGLPAVEVFGEGIYVELDEHCLVEWQTSHAEWLANRLDDGFVARLGGIFSHITPLSEANRSWASRYLLVHSLAHILINQLSSNADTHCLAAREALYFRRPGRPNGCVPYLTLSGRFRWNLGGPSPPRTSRTPRTVVCAP